LNDVFEISSTSSELSNNALELSNNALELSNIALELSNIALEFLNDWQVGCVCVYEPTAQGGSQRSLDTE
jgi:hypothetical protein